jgi:hypothetical protein
MQAMDGSHLNLACAGKLAAQGNVLGKHVAVACILQCRGWSRHCETAQWQQKSTLPAGAKHQKPLASSNKKLALPVLGSAST